MRFIGLHFVVKFFYVIESITYFYELFPTGMRDLDYWWQARPFRYVLMAIQSWSPMY